MNDSPDGNSKELPGGINKFIIANLIMGNIFLFNNK